MMQHCHSSLRKLSDFTINLTFIYVDREENQYYNYEMFQLLLLDFIL